MGARRTVGANEIVARRRPASLRQNFEAILLSAVILSTGILGGCAGLVSGPKTTTGQAAFQVSPVAINFGKVNVGKKSTQTIAVANTGTKPVSITQASISNPQFSLSGVTLPISIGTGQGGNLTVAVTPSATGTLTGTLTVQGSDGAAPAVVNLSATAVTPAPQISVSSNSFQFGTIGVGATGNQNLLISNTGSADLTISLISVTGTGFSVSGITTPKTIGAGQSASATLNFQPTVAGAASGTMSITSNDPATPTLGVALTGTGSTDPFGQIQANPTSVSFGTVSAGSNATKVITLSDTGTSPVQITSITASGAGFSVNGITVPFIVTSGNSTTLNAVFAPTGAGNASGNVTITSNANNSPLSIAFTGTGAGPALSVSPASFAFGSVLDGQTKSQTFTLTNTGTGPLTISQLSVSGAGYSLTGLATPSTVAAGASATFIAHFAPTTAGSLPGSITITSNAPTSPSTVALAGTGTALQPGLSVSPASFAFGSVLDGQTKSQTFTLTNTGTGPLTISQLSASGAGYSVTGLATPSTVAAGASATFSAHFAPTTGGSLPGAITISSNAPTSPSTVALTGTGVAGTVILSANPTSLAFGSVNSGATSSKNVTLKNSGTGNVTISQVTVNAKDVSTGGVTTPVTLTPGQSQVMSVSFKPTAQETVSGNITLTNSQGTNTVVSVTGTGMQAAISLTPSSANLGSVTLGATNSQTIQIGNTGNGVLTITQANVAGSGFSTSGLTLPLSINPGLTSIFNARYQPSVAGPASGSITLVSNAGTSPSVISLSGTGVTATQVLSLTSNSIGFGNVNTGASSTESVSVTNTGNANVQISQISIGGTGFSLSGASAPVTLTPTQKLTFSIIFSPTVAGNVSGTVTITSNATGSPATISLSGSGVAAVPHSVNLSWTASTSAVSGYNVYRSTTSGSGYAKLNGSLVSAVNYTDSSVVNGTTYYYVTTAVDSTGTESADSNEAVAIIP
jgi:hypothetical protein